MEKCSVVGRKISTILKRKTVPTWIEAGKRKEFRRRNTNLLFGFHSLSGLAQLLFSHRPSSFRSRLKTFGLPSRSRIVQHLIYYNADPSTPETICMSGVVLYFICDQESQSVLHQVFSFLLTTMHILRRKPWPSAPPICISPKGLEKP